MPNKPSKKKTRAPKSQSNALLVWVKTHKKATVITTFVVLIFTIVATNLYLQSTRHTAFLQAKSSIHTQLQNIDNWFTPPGEIVYDKLSDDGCGKDPSSWLGIYKVCSYTLNKVYKGSGEARTSLMTALSLLDKNGWISKGYLEDPGFGGRTTCEAKFVNREGGGCTYGLSDATKPAISFRFFPRDDPRYASTTPEQFFGIDQDITLTGDQYLYGIRVVGSYRE